MKILVADDDTDTVLSFTMLLQLAGHEVRSAADGQEAVDMAADFQPDAVLLDIEMPRLNGFEAATRIRAALPGVLLIAMTGWSNLGDDATFNAAGFDHHLLKPVDLARLNALLKA